MEVTENPLPEPVDGSNEDDGIVTTQEELDGFAIVKAMVRKVVDLERVVCRDTQSYFGIYLMITTVSRFVAYASTASLRSTLSHSTKAVRK